MDPILIWNDCRKSSSKQELEIISFHTSAQEACMPYEKIDYGSALEKEVCYILFYFFIYIWHRNFDP